MTRDLSVVVCAASGPSLTAADCALIAASGLPVMAVNNSWQRFSDLYALYAGDLSWWKANYDDVPSGQFRRITASVAASRAFAGLEYRRYTKNDESNNSGASCIEFAADCGARKIILVGYDCSLRHGTHWHGDHDKAGLRNPTHISLDKWQGEFLRARTRWPEVEIVNCSRYTELKCYPSKNLETEIASSLLRQDRVQQTLSHHAACQSSR